MMKNFVLVFLVYLSVASCNESLNDIDKNVVSATFFGTKRKQFDFETKV